MRKTATWGDEELFAFLKSPQTYIKGTRMAFAGIANPQDIADLISYLHTMGEK
jgi:cytochrome c